MWKIKKTKLYIYLQNVTCSDSFQFQNTNDILSQHKQWMDRPTALVHQIIPCILRNNILIGTFQKMDTPR